MRNRVWAGVFAVSLVACGGSTSGESGTGGSSTGGVSTGGVSTGGVSTGGVSTGGVSTGGVSTGGVSTGGVSPGGGGSGGSPGGCTPSSPCAATEYCDYSDNQCGAGQAGACKPKPQGCDLLYAPVCGCDGKVAGNECAAYTAGTDVSNQANCPPPDGMFACGSIFCTKGLAYCSRGVSDVGGEPDSYSCKTLPAGCSTCACLISEPCGNYCAADAQGNLTLTCPGG